jgi:hypothetical protein
MTVKGMDSKLSAWRKGWTYLCLLIDFKRCRSYVESGYFWDVVIFPLSFFFLEFEGDATDGSTLDTFHEMGGEAGDFVTEAFGGDDCL